MPSHAGSLSVVDVPAPVAGALGRVPRGWIRELMGRLPASLLGATDAVAIGAGVVLAPGAIAASWRAALGLTIFLGLSWQGTHHAGAGRQRPTTLWRGITLGGLAATTAVLAARSLMTEGPDADALLWAGAAATGMTLVLRSALQLTARAARRGGAGTVPTLIVGAGVVGRQLDRRMRLHPELGFMPVGFVDDDPTPFGAIDGEPAAVVQGPTAELEEIVRVTGARHVVFSFTRAPDSEVLPLLRACQRADIDVSVMPRLFENVNGRVRVEQLAGLPLLALRQTNPHSWQFAVKHGGDRVLAAVLLVLLLPVFALLAIAVRVTSPGPVLYSQRRVGRDGKPFDLLKFRSMLVSGAAPDEELFARFESTGVGPGGIEGVDRRTRVGGFLRRSGLDELPQLINVLRGEMSLVGPRPERPEFADRFGERLRRYDDRHLVRAGITGWAQVNGLRGQTSLAERIEWDNWYIQNWSLGLDLLALTLTPLAILRTPREEAPDVPHTDAADSASA